MYPEENSVLCIYFVSALFSREVRRRSWAWAPGLVCIVASSILDWTGILCIYKSTYDLQFHFDVYKKYLHIFLRYDGEDLDIVQISDIIFKLGKGIRDPI